MVVLLNPVVQKDELVIMSLLVGRGNPKAQHAVFGVSKLFEGKPSGKPHTIGAFPDFDKHILIRSREVHGPWPVGTSHWAAMHRNDLGNPDISWRFPAIRFLSFLAF